MKQAKNIVSYRKMEAAALRGKGKNDEIGEITGFHPDMAGRFAKEYLVITFGNTGRCGFVAAVLETKPFTLLIKSSIVCVIPSALFLFLQSWALLVAIGYYRYLIWK